MADIWMDVDAALGEVPVNLMPLIDSGDFVTVEDAVAFDAAGMDLRWNFVTTAGAFTSTAVTPTSGGNYDWAHQGDGMYSIEIPASGGASINNDTEGFGWFSGKITGVLPFRGPVIGFRAAALNDAFIDGTLAALLNKVADHVRRRTQANVEASSDGDALAIGSEYGMIQQCQESNLVDNPGFQTVYKTDGTTELAQRAVTTDAAAEPVTGIS